MAVTNGQVANETTFNNAFMSRTSNTSTTGKIDLNNVDAPSGSSITNIQREFNAIASFLGKAVNQAITSLPAWVSTVVGDPTDNIFERVEILSDLAGRRAAVVDIADATSVVVVTFGDPWPDDEYVIDFCIENTVDANPIFLQGMVTDRDANGFTVTLNAPTDSPDYKLNYSVKKAA